ncbi:MULTISPECIES: hypothetical protein [Citrobacter]|uniref:hypothetical protein n=1 Tax=Citrobacter TaxID=544 RepID=UPI0023A99FEA|nr:MULTISPECIES: hypothetical protein [Citrobacter]MDM3392527.1 hypothetical protein [Citrobacter sp. Cb014]WEA77610.1 hypothetical protein PXN04_13510 [Citrobacter braakii]
MSKNLDHWLVFTSNDIERMAKNSTAEVAAKKIVTVRDGRRTGFIATSNSKNQAPSAKGVYKEVAGRKAISKASGETKALAGSVLSQSPAGYSSKQAVDMFNQAFKKVRA